RRMARDDDSAAAGEWAWVIRRAPVAPGTCRAVEQCAVSALRSGDSELARWALGRARGDLIAEFPCETTARTAAAILATPLDTRGALAVNTPPIRPESYLSDNWCAVLTAVRAARPELSEVRLKNRLQAASYSPDEINLPPVDGFDDLRWAVRLLGAEPLVVASDRIEEMLGQGRPVLFRDPVRRSWGVVVWAAPKSDAVLWLDYGRWDRDRERPLSQAEVRQLVSSAEPAEQDRGRVRAEVSRLGSMSLLRASLAVDGDWAVAVVPRARDGTFTAPPGAATHGDALALLWQARHAVEKRAYLLGTRLAGRLAAGRPRDEILAIGALGLRSLGPPDPARRPSPDADRAAAGLLRPGGLEGLSPWALREIDEMAARLPAVSCESHREALERLRAWDPDDAGILERLLARAPIEGSGEETVRLALDMTRAKSFSPDSILWALRVIALSKPETPAARGALVALIRHIPILVPDAKGMPGSRANLAPYCAARAALSAGPREAVAWWRRATEIDPKNFPYQRRLAEALAAAGETAEAATARARQQELAGVERCGGGPDEEGATGEEETDDGEGLMTREAQR
ncbi:MAG TPA: hypothetical protein VFT43_09605, partial [Candidatus Polarisedimenticolia bacterium]|nr:hypothetical protein [Candidatus Polarisedimenticolia bacterium]